MLNKINKSTFILRGGGCGMPKANFGKQSQKNAIQTDVYDFFSQFNHYIQIIESKASIAASQQESSEIMIAIRWFIFQEENIYKISKNVQSVKKTYDLVLDGIKRLLISCQTYIRSDSFKCLYILQITTSLSKVIFSFHLMNDERFMKCETQNYFLEICDELQQQLEIERNDLIQNQIELFIFLTKTSFEIAPNNSKEKQEILQGSLKGIINSLIKMSPDTELLESLFKGACLLYKMQDISKKRKQYEVFYQLDMLQWEVISYFKNKKQKNLQEIILQIEAIYETIVQFSNNWRDHFIWIQMIGKILVFNPLLAKKKLGELNNSLNVGEKSTSQIWKDYINRGLLLQINQSNDLAVILLNQLQNNKIISLDRLLLEDSFKGWEDFLILKQVLMNEQNENTPYTFSSYLKCKLGVFREDSQNQEKNLTIEKMQKLLSFIISTKLINLITQNDENLGEVFKIQKQLLEDEQVNMRLLQRTVHSQIKKVICNLEEYLQNTQYILKILKLNQNNYQCQAEQFKQVNINELNNLQQLKYLMRLLEQILQQAIQKIKDKRNPFCIKNCETDEINMLQQQKELIQEELKNLNLKDIQFANEFQQKLHALPIATLNQKNFLKEAQSILTLIEHSQKQISNLEIIQLQQNNVIEYFRGLLHSLNCFYEHKNEELQKDVNEFILSFKKILILQFEIESVSQTEEFENIKQEFSNMLSFQFIFNQRLNNLKFKLQLIAFKESFQNILAVQSEEFQQLQKVINLDEFLVNVLCIFQNTHFLAYYFSLTSLSICINLKNFHYFRKTIHKTFYNSLFKEPQHELYSIIFYTFFQLLKFLNVQVFQIKFLFYTSFSISYTSFQELSENFSVIFK